MEKYQPGDLNDSTEATEEAAPRRREGRKGNRASRLGLPPRRVGKSAPKPAGSAPLPGVQHPETAPLLVSPKIEHPVRQEGRGSTVPAPHSPPAPQLLAEKGLSRQRPHKRGAPGLGFPSLQRRQPREGCSGSGEGGFKSPLPPPEPFPKISRQLSAAPGGGGAASCSASCSPLRPASPRWLWGHGVYIGPSSALGPASPQHRSGG